MVELVSQFFPELVIFSMCSFAAVLIFVSVEDALRDRGGGKAQ